MKKYLIIFMLFSLPAFAQDDSEKKFFVDGYLKDMVITEFPIADTLSTRWTNLVHNRFNFEYYPNDKWSAYAGVRTRWYTGAYVSDFPNFSDQLFDTEDYFNLSWIVAENSNNVLATEIDRLYVEYASGDWDARLGRQRINWGVSMVWNPNDLFNAYSFVDFDYEERPGTDALRIQKYTGFASSFEVAANLSDSLDKFVAAMKWATNKSNYDFQVITGLARQDFTIGGAWAGNIKGAGFKGEFTYFLPVINNPLDPAFVGTLSYDYNFKSSLYLNLSYLYNSNGALNSGVFGFADFYYGQISARNLTPYKHSALVMTSYQFHPLIFGSLAFMGFPGNKSFFVNPTVTVSVLNNFDLDLVCQFFYGEFLGDFGALNKSLYTRLKWSF